MATKFKKRKFQQVDKDDEDKTFIKPNALTQDIESIDLEPHVKDDISDAIFYLNVGDQVFKTTKRTLVKAQYFRDLFQRKIYCPMDGQHYFVDRDPYGFRCVLEYLRGAPLSFRDYNKHKHEFLFYGVDVKIDIPAQASICWNSKNIQNSRELDIYVTLTHSRPEQKDKLIKVLEDKFQGKNVDLNKATVTLHFQGTFCEVFRLKHALLMSYFTLVEHSMHHDSGCMFFSIK